jgi:hypothetical protein
MAGHASGRVWIRQECPLQLTAGPAAAAGVCLIPPGSTLGALLPQYGSTVSTTAAEGYQWCIPAARQQQQQRRVINEAAAGATARQQQTAASGSDAAGDAVYWHASRSEKPPPLRPTAGPCSTGDCTPARAPSFANCRHPSSCTSRTQVSPGTAYAECGGLHRIT